MGREHDDFWADDEDETEADSYLRVQNEQFVDKYPFLRYLIDVNLMISAETSFDIRRALKQTPESDYTFPDGSGSTQVILLLDKTGRRLLEVGKEDLPEPVRHWYNPLSLLAKNYKWIPNETVAQALRRLDSSIGDVHYVLCLKTRNRVLIFCTPEESLIEHMRHSTEKERVGASS